MVLLHSLGLACAALLVPQLQQASQPAANPLLTSAVTQPNGVAAGDVRATSAVLWARPELPGATNFTIATEANPSVAVASRTVSAAGGLNPLKLRFGGLVPGTRYIYRVTDASGTVLEGRFRTPHADTQSHGLRFGVSGDSRGELKPFFSVQNAPARDLEFFLLLGDTIYADVPSPQAGNLPQVTTPRGYAAKHAEVLSGPTGQNFIADLRASTALWAVIDDHEVTNDFSGGAAPTSHPLFGSVGQFINETPLFETGLKAFQDFHPIVNEYYADTGDARTAFKRKLYRTQTYGQDAAIFLIDARSFRDAALPPADPSNPVSVGTFLAQSFDPSRTMLGQAQLQDLLADLSQAEAQGVTWKFIFVPEPIQNLGVAAASDRFEGYAAERSLILDYIKSNGIQNVVFVCADIHGTLVNNLTYQQLPFGPQIAVDSFEISTGAIAYDAPFGPTVVELAASLGLLSAAEVLFYNSLPVPFKDGFIETLVNAQLSPLGYDTVGLNGSSLGATLEAGGYVATHVWGWTEFEIDAVSAELRVTTYGQQPKTSNPPTAVQVFRVPAK